MIKADANRSRGVAKQAERPTDPRHATWAVREYRPRSMRRVSPASTHDDLAD